MSRDKQNPRAIFIRHSESTGNAEDLVKGTKDYPLDATGKKESVALATRIARYKPSVVISSPLSRALVPAKQIANKAGVKLIVDHGLLPPDYGTLTGEPRETGEPKIKKLALETPDKNTPGTKQGFNDWVTKSGAAIRRVKVMMAKGERPAVVTHSRNLRELPHALFGAPVADPTRGGPQPSGFVTLHAKRKLILHRGVSV